MEVLGRHALLFDDDTMAAFVNSEDALVEWHSLKIDRYDVRHLLSAPPPPRRRNRSYEPRASDDPAVDFLIEQERYLDLPLESDQPALEGEEEEEKPSGSGGYRAVAFSYGNTGDSADQENTDVGMEAKGFLPPFSVPGDIVQSLPPTEKIHQIIARTAIFVSKHGGQTEIILRVKQGDNPTFGFLMPDHPLHAYFRYLVEHPELLHTEIEEKSHDESKTAGTKNNGSGNVGGALSLLGSAYGSGEDEDGDDALNASLSLDTKSTESMEAAVKGESLSRKLILSNKDKVPAVKKNSSIISSKPKSVKGIKKEDNAALISAKEEKLRNRSIGATPKPIIEPPQELKRLIDKLVEFVMRNGRQFEATLLEQDSKLERFPFLLSSDQYHPYYLRTLEAAQESKVNGKILNPGQDDLGGRGNSKKAPVVNDEFCDLPFDSDRKEKFKMVIGKSKKEAQETERESQESGFTVDAAAAAAILQAATKGIKSSGLRFITSTAPNSHDNAVQKEDATSNTNMTEEQKLKAERLKRAKMFVAMLKSGALPSRTGTSRGSSAEPVELGLLKSAAEASSASHEREGSLAPAVVEKSADDGNFIERQSVRQSKRKYRSRSIGIEDDEEDSHREGHSNRKHRSRSRNPEDDDDENEQKFYQEKGRHPSHSTEENKNEVESIEENICREERDDKGNEKYSERIHKSRTRSHKEDDEVGKDRKHRRKRRRSCSTSEESENGEESDGQGTEHKHYKSKHHAHSPQRDKSDSKGAYKEERAKERRSHKSRSRRHKGSSKSENAVEEEDKHYRSKHSSHSSHEESEDESDHRQSKPSHSKYKEDHRKDIHKEERDHKRSKKSRHSHRSSSESPSRRKKHHSSHTSHHSRDRQNRHRNAHSSKDKESRKRHHKHDSSSDDEHQRRTRKESRDPRVELEEGEISHTKDESVATVSGDGKRGASVDIITSSETTEVPADLRAKIRAMLMSTRS